MIHGIHHVTSIIGDPQENIDFYAGVMGLRLVKRTVNFDDPGIYHFYYGDELGRPGTIMTFFPWPGRRSGRRGVGQVTVTGLSVPASSLGFWSERLKAAGIAVEGPSRRFNEEEVLTFLDPHGLKLELVAHGGAEAHAPWSAGGVPKQHAVRGFHSVTLAEDSYEDTAELLADGLGLHLVGESGDRFRFAFSGENPGTIADVMSVLGTSRGRVAVGTVHHVAWRAASDDDQMALRKKMIGRGLTVTAVLDRNYFRSIYFREPGGVLFEIATDAPEFSVDEAPAALGQSLKFPEWLEPQRAQIEQQLPAIQVPGSAPTPAAGAGHGKTVC